MVILVAFGRRLPEAAEAHPCQGRQEQGQDQVADHRPDWEFEPRLLPRVVGHKC
jgi:hypothetical protein